MLVWVLWEVGAKTRLNVHWRGSEWGAGGGWHSCQTPLWAWYWGKEKGEDVYGNLRKVTGESLSLSWRRPSWGSLPHSVNWLGAEDSSWDPRLATLPVVGGLQDTFFWSPLWLKDGKHRKTHTPSFIINGFQNNTKSIFSFLLYIKN